MADNNEFKISLGVELDTDDLGRQISAVENKLDPIKIQIDAETKELAKQIESALKTLTNGSKNVLTLDTTKVEASLNEVAQTIKDIKASFSTIDNKSGIKSLLSTVDQIGKALDKASDKFDKLNAELSALGKKDFGFNFNIKTGNSNPVKAMTDYGREARRNTIPALQEQVSYLREALGGTEEADRALKNYLFRLHKGFAGNAVKTRLEDDMVNASSLAKRMDAYDEYISYLKKIASMNGVDLSDFDTKFSKSSNELIDDVTKIQTGAKQAEEELENVTNKLKQVFGGGIGAEQLSAELKPIIDDLRLISEAVMKLSKNTSFSGLTKSFDRLSESLEKLMANATAVQKTLGEGFNSSINSSTAGVVDNNAVKSAQQTGREIGNAIELSIEQSLDVDDIVDEQVRKLMDAYGIKGSKAFDEIRQAVVAYRNELMTTDNADDNAFDNTLGIRQVTSALANNMKVADETKETYAELVQYIKEFNNSGRKVSLMGSIKEEYGDDFRSMRSSLGKGFTTKGGGLGFDVFIDELNSVFGNVIDTSKGYEYAFEDLVNKLRLGRDNKKISGDDIFKNGYSIHDMEDEITSTLSAIDRTISDKQIAKLKEIGFDTANFDKAESELNDVKNRIKEVTQAAEKNKQALENVYSEAAEGMQNAGVDSTPENFENLKGSLTERYESNIAILEEEKAELQSKLSVLEETYNRERRLLTESYQQIRENTEQRKLEAQQAQETANIAIQSAEKEQQAAKEMANAYEEASNKKIVDTTQSDTGLDAVEDDLEAITVTANNTSDAIKKMRETLNSLDYNVTAIDDITKELEELGFAISKVTIKADGNDLDITVKGINDAKEAVTVIKHFSDESGQWSTVGRTISQSFDEGTEAAKRFKKEAELASKIQIGIEVGDFDESFDRMTANYSKLSGASEKLENSLEETKQAFKVLNEVSEKYKKGADNADELISAQNRYNESLEKTNNLIKIQARQENKENAAAKLKNDAELFNLKIDSWLSENSAAINKFGRQMLDLKVDVESVDRVTLNHLKQEFQKLDAQADKAGLKMQTLGDRIKTKFKEYSAYFSVAEVFMYVTQGLRDMFDQVVAIDTAMTELKKVTDESDATYSQFLSNAASRAKELGVTIDGLVTSAADFARLGYDFKDVQGLAEVANIYAVVGDEIDSVDTATQSLVSTLTAFKEEANGLSDSDFAMSIVDKFNEVSNNFAISSGGIGEALQRSASSMAAANNTLDETIALITAANTVVQDPDSVGTAFKTISMRIRGAKTELEEAGLETEGMATSVSTLRSEIKALSGVDIMLNANEFKSTYQIMEELAAKWQDLTDIQQATITELIAGKRQGNIVSSLMNNFDIAQNALETSLNSTGSAMQEHEKWQKSLEAQILKLKSAWQSLSQTFLSSDFLKAALDIVIDFVNVIEKLISTIGTLPTFGVGVGIWGMFDQLSTVTKKSGGLKSLTNIANILPTLTKAFPNAAAGIKVFTDSLKTAQYIQTFSSLLGYTNGGATLAGAATVAKGALSGLWTVMKAHPVLTAVAAIGLAVTVYDKFTESAEELAERVGEVTSKYKEQHDSLIKLKGDYDTSNADSMISKYGELSKGVNGLGENLSLTTDEYAEYQSIVNTIAEQIPSLVTGYNSQGDAILDCAGDVDKLAESYKNLIKEQNEEVLSTGNDIFKDFKNDLKDSPAYYKTSTTDKFGNIVYKDNYNTDYLSKIDELMNMSDEELETAISKLSSHEVEQISKTLEQYGNERNVLGSGDKGWETQREHIVRALGKDKAEIGKILKEASADLNAYAEDMGAVTEAYFSTAFLGGNDSDIGDYSHMSEKMQNIINQITSGFGSEFYNIFSNKENPYEALAEYFDSMLSAFDSLNSADAAKFEAAFDLKTQFNGGKISYGEYINGIQDAARLIDGLGLKEEVESQLKLALDTEEVTENYNALTKRLVEISTRDIKKLGHFSGASDAVKMATEDAKKFLNSLTASEYSVAVDLIANDEIDLTNFNIDSLRDYIESEAKIRDALNFEANIEVDTTALEVFNEILAESASAMGLTSDSIKSLEAKYSDLDGYDAAKLFERTANGVKVNREELTKLEKKYNDLNKAEVQEHIDTLTQAYNDNVVAIDKCSNAAERAKLISENETYKNQIEELATYQAQLEGVTGAYQRWLSAQETPEDYQGYEAVATGREDVQSEIDRGFIGNATKEYIDLLSGKDLQGGTIDDYADAWEKLDDKVTSTGYSVHDFFTLNEDGDITSKGIDRFFKSLQADFKGSVAKFNDETKKWEYDFGTENLEKIQEKWGIGIEAIELLLEAAASAGYDIDWDGILDGIDLDTSNFETLVSTAESAQIAFNKLEGVEDVSFNFTCTGVEQATSELEKARSTYIDLITNDDGTINLNANGAEEMRVILATLLIQKQQLEDSNIAINIDTSGLDESQQDIANAINAVKTFREKYKNLEIAVTTGQGIEEAKTELNTAMTELQGLGDAGVDIAAELILGEGATAESLNSKVDAAISAVGSKDIKVGCKLDETAIGTLNSQVLANFTPEATVKITGIDDALVSQYTSTEKTAEGTVKWKNDDKLVVSYSKIKKTAQGTVNWENNTKNVKTSFSATGTVSWTSGNNVKVNVVSEANGTANANGTAQSGRAFAKGNWGINGSGTALVGELGMETLVRDGRFYTIGDNGAEFIKYQQGDIIFNHRQTEELFKNGKVTSGGGRGRMFANGSAFADGSYPSTGRAFAWSATASGSNFADNRKNTKAYSSSYTPSKSSSSSSKSSSSSSEKEFEETLDWIETKIDRIERTIDQLDTKASSVYRSWSERNKALASEISKVGDEISLQQKAYDRYIQEANSVGLSESWAKLVRDGAIDIDTITDENLADKIKDYQTWFEKALDCKDAILELQEAESKLYAQRFENVSAQYDGILQGFEHTETMLNEYISQAEEQGYIVSKKYYEALIDNEKSNIAQLRKEQADLIASRDEAVDSGAIVKGSEEWYNMCAEIDGVTQAIEESTTALLEYDNAMRDIDWSVFDLIQERISDVTDEADFLIDLMSNDKLFDDNGRLTSQGLATMGLHAQNYNTHMYQADEYGAEVTKLNKQIASDPYDQELINRRNEILELQRESILAAEDEKEAIRDMVEEGIELELDALNERIEKYEEALDSQKDLYDYQKKVKEQTEEIASLEKQMAAYSGDDSEEAKQKIQQIKVDLESAREDLQETEYDKYVSDQQQLLDTLYDEYELILNQRLDNVDYLLEQVVESINAVAGADSAVVSALGSEGAISVAISDNATSIKTTLETETKNVGTTLSNAMNQIWSTGEGNAKSVLTMYGEDFKTKSTTINTTLNGIKTSVNNVVNALNKEATKKVSANKTTTSAKKDPTKTTTTSKKTTTTTKKSSGDGKPKIGDKVIFVSGQYYYDSQGKKPLGSKYKGKQVYITNINTRDWATHGYHISTGKKLGDGDLGWLKLNQISGYASGKKNFLDDEVAWTQENGTEFIVRPSDGAILTPIARKGSVLNAQASNNLWDMTNSPAEFIRDNLNLGAADIPNNSSVQNSYVQNLDKVVFNLPNVKNYDEFLSAMQKDKNFERLITSMTIDRIAGKSSLAKGKSIR